METDNLEQELRVRIMVHRMLVLGGVLMKEYIDKHTSLGSPNFPEFMLKEQANKYMDEVVRSSLEDGTFNQRYELAWEEFVEVMPEHVNLMMLGK